MVAASVAGDVTEVLATAGRCPFAYCAVDVRRGARSDHSSDEATESNAVIVDGVAFCVLAIQLSELEVGDVSTIAISDVSLSTEDAVLAIPSKREPLVATCSSETLKNAAV